MAVLITPTTELEAVNQMLATIGESPVSTLEDATIVDATMARDRLRSEMRALQSKGWEWNTDEEYELTPNVDNRVEIPESAAWVDPSRISGKRYTWRGQFLYDRTNRTYTITEAVKCDIIWLLDFDEMPEPARRYAMIRASRKFHDENMGDDAIHKFSKEDEIMAWTELVRNEAKSGDYNILTSNRTGARIAGYRRKPWLV